MQTFKKLGCKISKHRTGVTGKDSNEWMITGNGLPTVNITGNKGVAMSEALRQWSEAGLVVFDRINGWHRA